MKTSKLERVLYTRRVFQMSAVTIILVLVISIAIVFTTGSPINDDLSCGPVQNLIVEETETELIFSWRAPTGSGCNGSNMFRIKIEINGVVSEEFFPAFAYRVNKKSCSKYVFTVSSTLISGEEASSTFIEHFSGFAGSGNVLDLGFENNLLEWNKPANSEGCNLKYEVEVKTDGLNPTKQTVSDQFVQLSFIPCSENTISVTAIVSDNGRRGEEAVIKEQGPVTSKPPVHKSTSPQLTGALATWIIENEATFCIFYGIELKYFVSGSSDVVYVRFPREESGIYQLVNLNGNTRYTYAAKWILETSRSGEISDEIHFKTTPLSNPTSISSIKVNDEISIEWEQDYDLDFITGHKIVVENLGPNHFLPEKCQTDEGEIDEFLEDPDTNSLIFSKARPNFNYRITVTTLFENLGLSTSSQGLITVPIEDPGYLEGIEWYHTYENGVQYAIKSQVEWKIPCDINGPIRHFDVKISGKLNVNGVNSVCNVDFFTKRVLGEEKETFEVVTDVLVPFFDYSIVITTVLESQNEKSSENRKDLSPVPDPYTPLN